MTEKCVPDNPKYEILKIQNMEPTPPTVNCDAQPAIPDADDGDADDSFDQDDGFDENSTSMDNFSEADNIDFDDDLGINMENKNTQRKTDTDIRILITYLRSINEMKPPENVPPLELDRYLSTFFSIVKKHDGNEYEPASLRGMLCSVERYLKMKNYPASVTRDLIFANTRHALKLKQQKLREIGKGSKKPIEPFGKVTLEKVDQLFSAREMGPYTPMSVINTLCFVFIVHFRLRKAIDHKNLLWGDVRLKTNEHGKEYLSYEPLMMNSQDGSKSDNGTNREKVPKLCVFAKPDSPEKDPVGIYKLYSEKRPSTMHYDSSPFYLGITTLHPTAMQAWYRTCAMGVNKLSDLVRMIRDITGLPRATLNAPAESLLAESYATNSFIRNDIPYQMSSSSRTYTPILPKTSDIVVRLSKPSSQKQTSVNLDENGPEPDNSRSTTSPRSVQTNTNHGSQIEVLSDSSPRPDSLSSATEDCSSNESVYLNLESAKSQINDMLQKMDLTAIVEFDRWLKRIKISRDPRTGNVVCRESTKDHDGDQISGEIFPDLSTANITLNISLTPMSIIGKDPVTVTAHTNMSSSHDNDDLETLDRSDHISRGKSDKLIISQNAGSKFKKRIQENLSGKDIEESDLNHSKAKRPRSSGSVPVNLSNKPSNDIPTTTSQNTSDAVVVSDSMSTVAAIIATAKSADAFVRNCSTAINNPQLQATRLTNSVLTPSLVSGMSSAPQAHTQFLQRLQDREGGLIVPVPIGYPGQKYYTRDNLMLPNQAIFASLSHQPGTAHATYFPQAYQASMTTAATATQQKGPIVSVAPCVKTEPS